MERMEKKLEVKNLVISFKTNNGTVKAVRDISFELNKGETLAIVGESGSGKSVTSKAILGILAGNSIVEGGKILYDGKDLLRIQEDDFHKIRGDKIAMIFQDPLSSLNPIVRIGRQLTEAMLLKNANNKRNARKDFSQMLHCLEDNMNEFSHSTEQVIEENKQLVKEFYDFTIVAIKIENEYIVAKNAVSDCLFDLDDLLLNIEKEQDIEIFKILKPLLKECKDCVNDYVIKNDNDEYFALLAQIAEESKLCKGKEPTDTMRVKLQELRDCFVAALAKDKPDFFDLAYYKIKNPEADLSSLSVAELNKMTMQFCNENIMDAFKAKTVSAISHANNASLLRKQEVIKAIADEMSVFEKDTLVKEECNQAAKRLVELVEASINRLSIAKDTQAYTFKVSLDSALEIYFKGVRKNPREMGRYQKQLAKHTKLTNQGKEPTWKVTPPQLVDLELAKKNIVDLLTGIRDKYLAESNSETKPDFEKMANDLIEYLQDKATSIVYTITSRMAKNIAIKLMEEVGIPEPRRRYKQYPFEFSGGMRQRIVIAIALAANPDILICDEPTTALDVTIQAQILELINNLKTERNLSVIFITHDLGVVANMADRIAVMYAGKIVEYGTAEEVFYDPRHPYTWALLASMPDLDTNEKLDAIPGTPPNMIYPPVGDAFAVRNKYALQIDFEQQPPMFKISDSHYASTWLLHPNAPKAEPPKIVTDRIQRMKKLNEEADQ